MKIISFAILLTFFSCNANDSKTTNASVENSSSTGGSDDQKKQLTEQSRACIALMNSLENDLNAATASHDAQAAAAIQLRIDSTAKENVRIGQKLLALDNK